ncbi:hypothetical protein LENED_005648 [Lentinula edodes]|uniref:Uncharacterized protein n=1 Tax=Lentinula edodes TaxID=5353 RepID=A0A1Q3E9X1_LENED|nr:hypothetical protein LENED_005648 [Lentinula edodes]
MYSLPCPFTVSSKFHIITQDPDMKRCNIVRGDGKGRGVFNLLHYRDSQACTVQVNERLLFSAPLTFDSHCSERKLQYIYKKRIFHTAANVFQ